ncbi:MAG: response regulator [Nitrospiraceae bacterium]|nr:response regulator [Nitrospiraceae bacterium]
MPFNLIDKKILLADDSAIMRMVLSLHLRRFTGATITLAMNGREALAKLSQERFDLLLTDINMPEMNGIELIRAVRQSLRSDIPIVIITTKGETRDRDEGMAQGADGYLTKPVNVKDLITTVIDRVQEREFSGRATSR